MTVVIAYRSPLKYLSSSNRSTCARLYGVVVVPQQVISELIDPAAPDDVRAWASNFPTGLTCVKLFPVMMTWGISIPANGPRSLNDEKTREWTLMTNSCRVWACSGRITVRMNTNDVAARTLTVEHCFSERSGGNLA